MPVVEILRLCVFAGFVTLGILAWIGRERRHTNHLIGYTLVVSLAVGAVQIESWPFSNWALVWAEAPDQMTTWQIRASSSDGRQYVVDPRVLNPLGNEDFGTWLLRNFRDLPEQDKREVSAWILAMAEEGRRRFLATGQPGGDARWFGRLSAPRHFAPYPDWIVAEDVPESAFESLEIVLLEWDVAEREKVPEAFVETRLYEFRP